MSKLSKRLPNDLQNEFPGVGGFSTSNLWRMKGFCEAYTDSPKLAPLVREIGWSKNLIVTARSKDLIEREFYLAYLRPAKSATTGCTNRLSHYLNIFKRAQAKFAMKDKHISDLHEINEKLNTVAASLAVIIDKNLKGLES